MSRSAAPSTKPFALRSSVRQGSVARPARKLLKGWRWEHGEGGIYFVLHSVYLPPNLYRLAFSWKHGGRRGACVRRWSPESLGARIRRTGSRRGRRQRRSIPQSLFLMPDTRLPERGAYADRQA